MIIDDVHQVAFVHIPKCGGTSVSLQLSAVDSYAGAFRKKGMHAELAAIHYAHIPLVFLREYYPTEFQKISRYRGYALTRDPYERFASATFQRLEEFQGIRKIDVTRSTAIEEAREVAHWLDDHSSFCTLEYIHFSRQTDYVAIDGQPVVSEVFALEHLSDLIAALQRDCKIPLDADRRENTNFASGNRLLSVIHLAKPIYSRLTPWSFRERVLLAMRRRKGRGPDGLYDAFRQDGELSSFVERYYAEDFELYRNALKHHDERDGRLNEGASWSADLGRIVCLSDPQTQVLI